MCSYTICGISKNNFKINYNEEILVPISSFAFARGMLA